MLLLVVAPALTGCLERSTTVGDRYSGTIIVATSADNPRGTPKLEIPQSMAREIAVTEYREGPAADQGPGASSTTADTEATRIGSRATFTGVTAGQLGQLGDIVADSFGDSAMTLDLTAKRNGEVVRFHGTADLTGLTADRDLMTMTITFSGPLSATNGEQDSDTTVTWTPAPGKPADLTAEATYADPATAAFGSWSWLMALICAAVVAVVIRLAYVSRDRSPRPGRPADSPESSAAPKRRFRGRKARSDEDAEDTGDTPEPVTSGTTS
ncbi:MAG: DUF3153 domain-containing protein [Gordonia sp. (in: high G+C Gram-positive bacteria)]